MASELFLTVKGRIVLDGMLVGGNYNTVEAKKYWYVEKHWSNQYLWHARMLLRDAIKNLKKDGHDPSVEKDQWKTELTNFAHLLEKIHNTIQHIDGNARCGLRQLTVSINPSNSIISGVESRDDGKNKEADTNVMIISVRSKSGMVTMKSQRDATDLYFQLLRDGERESDPFVQKIKNLALKWNTGL